MLQLRYEGMMMMLPCQYPVADVTASYVMDTRLITTFRCSPFHLFTLEKKFTINLVVSRPQCVACGENIRPSLPLICIYLKKDKKHRVTHKCVYTVCVCVCVPMPTHCTITRFGFRARRIHGVKCGLFSNHAPLDQTTLRVG